MKCTVSASVNDEITTNCCLHFHLSLLPSCYTELRRPSSRQNSGARIPLSVMAFIASVVLRSSALTGRRLLCPTSSSAQRALLCARAAAAAAPEVPPTVAGTAFAVPSTPATASTAAGAESRTSSTTRSSLTATRFSSLGLAPPLERALAETFAYDTATTVQERSIPPALAGRDVLVKAKTGTGKTLAFSLPALQRVIMTTAPPGENVRILVLSPTRELALQIAAEAGALASFSGDWFRIQTVVGGTNVKSDVRKFKDGMPTMLIATPGRLMDHLETSSTGLARALRGLDVLVLDEADRLMDMGFRPSVERILRQVPGVESRQTLLFSATMPADVRDMTRLALKPSHSVIDCVGADTATHAKVSQKVVVAPMAQTVAALKVVIDELMAASPDAYKIMVFFPTARQCQIHAELWRAMVTGRKGKMSEDQILEIHSRKTQAYRTRTAGNFRSGSQIIMFSSDVTARGMDFPDVTAVVQFGRPSDREQYVHRLGRTARGDGLVGRGVLVLGDFEARGVSKLLADLPVAVMKLDEHKLARAADDAGYGFAQVAQETKEQAYQATLGYYKQFAKNLGSRGMNASELVATVNEWALDVAGCTEVPALRAQTVGKMGLRGTPGLRISGKARDSRRGSGEGGGGRGSNDGESRVIAERSNERGGRSAAGPGGGRGERHHPGGTSRRRYVDSNARDGRTGERSASRSNDDGGRDYNTRDGRIGARNGVGSFRGGGGGSSPPRRGGGGGRHGGAGGGR